MQSLRKRWALPFQGVTICKKPMSFDLEKTDISDDHLFHGRWASSVSEILVSDPWISFNPEKVLCMDKVRDAIGQTKKGVNWLFRPFSNHLKCGTSYKFHYFLDVLFLFF